MAQEPIDTNIFATIEGPEQSSFWQGTEMYLRLAMILCPWPMEL